MFRSTTIWYITLCLFVFNNFFFFIKSKDTHKNTPTLQIIWNAAMQRSLEAFATSTVGCWRKHWEGLKNHSVQREEKIALPHPISTTLITICVWLLNALQAEGACSMHCDEEWRQVSPKGLSSHEMSWGGGVSKSRGCSELRQKATNTGKTPAHRVCHLQIQKLTHSWQNPHRSTTTVKLLLSSTKT